MGRLHNKILTLTKDSKAGLLATKDQHYVQDFIPQFNLDTDSRVK